MSIGIKKKQTMKQYLYTIRIGVILLITTIFTACSNEDTATDNPLDANTYSLTINASKGEDDTRALSLDGTKLNATWTVDEAVTVYNNTKSAELSGTLKAKKAGSSTTLSGSLSGSIEVDDVLTLKFCSDNNYHSQGGTLDYIASHCDYATATVKVAAISGGNISIKESAANFKNQQAIVKFTLKDKADGTTALNATSLVVTVGSSTTYTVTPTATASDLFVAIPGISGENVTLSAKVGSDTYTYNKTGVTFENGKYYTIGVKMTRQANSADLGKVIAQNGCIYDNIAAVPTSSTSAAGMIAYVDNASDCAHGLAIALEDEDESGFGNAGKAANQKNTKMPVVGGTWRIPSKEDWQNMFLACRKDGDAPKASTDMKIAGFQEKISSVGTGFTNGTTYWTSTDSPSAYCIQFTGTSQATVQGGQDKSEYYKARAVLAF
jgi:hypothetical protein